MFIYPAANEHLGCFNFLEHAWFLGWAGGGLRPLAGLPLPSPSSTHPASLPLTACTEVPGTRPCGSIALECGWWSSLANSPVALRSAHIPIPTPVSSLPSPSFPTFSVMRRGHHSDLLPPQPAFFETSLSASAPCKDIFKQAQAFSS